MYSDITGIILAGGKSLRMGVNKSFLKLGNETIIKRQVELMKSISKEVIIITNTPAEYEFLQIPLYEDVYKSKGPLGGIHSGLIHSKTEKNFIISCDMPLVTENLIEFIINYNTDKLITISKADGFIQQLCGVYSKKVLPEIIKILEEVDIVDNSKKQGECGCIVLQLVKSINGEIINIASEYNGYKEGMFYNMNNPAEYEFLRKKLLIS